MNTIRKDVVLITGAAGDIGSALARALAQDYTVIGLDRPGTQGDIPIIGMDLTSEEEIKRALLRFASTMALASPA